MAAKGCGHALPAPCLPGGRGSGALVGLGAMFPTPQAVSRVLSLGAGVLSPYGKCVSPIKGRGEARQRVLREMRKLMLQAALRKPQDVWQPQPISACPKDGPEANFIEAFSISVSCVCGGFCSSAFSRTPSHLRRWRTGRDCHTILLGVHKPCFGMNSSQVIDSVCALASRDCGVSTIQGCFLYPRALPGPLKASL